MKNSSLKNSLVAAGVAVFAGVVTLGANVAFGVATPTQNPTEAALYSPVFEGVDIQGKIKNSDPAAIAGGAVFIDDSLQAQGPITAISGLLIDSGWGIKSRDLDGTGIVAIRDNFGVYGKNAAANKPIKINGDEGSITPLAGTLQIKGKMDVTEAIKNSTNANGGDVVLDDNVKVTGAVDVPTGAVNALELVATGGVTGNFLKTTGGITGAALALTDDSGIESTSPSGKLRIQSPLDAWYGIVNSNTDNNGDPLPVKIADSLSVEGDVTAGVWLKTKDFQSTGALWSDGAAYFKHLDVFNEGIGDVTIEAGNIQASGKIKAKGGFGTTNRRQSAVASLAAGGTGSTVASCNGSEKLLSCGADLSGWGYLNSLVPDYTNSTCTAYAKNTEDAAKNLYAFALCLDPAL